jgi:hypothetical protein
MSKWKPGAKGAQAALALLAEARAAGVTLWTDGQALCYRGNEDSVLSLLPRLKTHKADLLALLAGERGVRVSRRIVRGWVWGDGRWYAPGEW